MTAPTTRRSMRTNSRNMNPIVDFLLAQCDLKNDAKLADALKITKPGISKIRHCVVPVSADQLLRMHDYTGLSLDQLRQVAGLAPLLERRP